MRCFESSRAQMTKASGFVPLHLFAESSRSAKSNPSGRAMTKSELENLLRKAGKLARDPDFFLIGSQSLRGVCASIPSDFPKTSEADLYPRHHPQAWSILREELGNRSKFFAEKGYYLDCTDPALATLPEGWTERLIPFRTPRTGGVTAWCLEPHDLFVSKLVVWREKDQQFVRAMLRHNFVKRPILLSRIEDLPISPARQNELKNLVSMLVTNPIPRKSPTRK